MLSDILAGVLEHDQSHAMQRMALATLSVDEGYGFPLIRALAQVGDLLPEARTFLANHEETWVRELVWSRGDATADQLAAALRGGERRPAVLVALCRAADVDALTIAVTGRRMNKPLALALTQTARWDLPKDIIDLALRKQVSSGGYVDYHGLFKAGYDLSALVADPQLPPLERLYAASGPGTSMAVVEEHFTQIVLAGAALRTPDEQDGVATELLRLRRRQAQSRSLREQYASLREQLPFDTADIDAAWAKELEVAIVAEQQDTVDFSAEAIATPNALRDLWATMDTDDMRRAFALDFLEHLQCDAGLFDDITGAGYGKDADHVRVDGQLFWLQREDLFKAAARRERTSMVAAAVAARRDGSQTPGVLASWMTDVLLEDYARLPISTGAMLGQWGQLLALPDYPRKRLSEIPSRTVAYVIERGGDKHSWVAKQLATELAPLAHADPEMAATLLNNSMRPEAPICGLLKATLVALGD